jgi:hypothetical protein
MIMFLAVSQPLLADQSLNKPLGNVVFTVAGNITNTNSDAQALFDLAMLLDLDQKVIITDTPWIDGAHKFEGPLLKDIINYVGGQGSNITATALNGYKVVIPYQDLVDYPVILALKQDDSILSVRKRGPGWVIYPWSDNSALQNNKYYTRSVWQLKKLEIE